MFFWALYNSTPSWSLRVTSLNTKRISNKLNLNLSSSNNDAIKFPLFKRYREERSLLSHAYLPVISLVFGEVENLFCGLIPFSIRVLPSLTVEGADKNWS